MTDAPSGRAPTPEPTPGGVAAPDPVPARPRHTARWIAGTVLVVAAGLIAVLATRPPATVSELRSPVVGTMAPPVRGVTLTGAPFVLPRVPGKFVVLNFAASWCQPCQAEGPQLVSFAFRHEQTGDAEVVGVVFDDSPSVARAAQATLGATWPTLADAGGTIALNYGVRAPPSTFLIAPDGRVVAYVVSSVTASELDALIARAKATGA